MRFETILLFLIMKINIILLFLYCCCSLLNGQNFKEKTIKKHITYLASDSLKGRGTASPEEIKAANYIAGQFKAAGLTPFNNQFLKAFKYKKSSSPHDTSTATAVEKTAYNVVGYLDNKSPYTIVIGAHYDHLGLGHDHNSLDANPDGKIHNGADDNASGTAGVIELAGYFSTNKTKEPFNMLFICFSGEELGLIGSKKWCENPDIQLKDINYMVNLDMVGRLNDSTKKLVIYGVGTSPLFVPLIDSLKSGLSIKKDSSGIGPSDQTSFYLKDVPVLHFFTGQHADYHKPSDDVERVNLRGMVEVLGFISQFIEKTFQYPKMTFLKTRTPDTGKVSFKVTMGVMPDYTYEGKGMRIDGVTDNKPAAKAGILKGDVVKKLGTDEITDVQTYMKALSRFKKGDTTTVEVDRNGEIKAMNITF